MTTVLSAVPQHARRFVAAARRIDVEARTGRPAARQVVMTLCWLAAMVTTASVRTGELVPPDTVLWLGVLGSWAPLLVRTYRPTLALVATVVAESMVLIFLAVPDPVSQATGGMGAYQPVPLATMLATATFASRVPSRIGWAAGLGAGTTLGVIGWTIRSGGTYLTDLVLFYLVVTAAVVGVWWSGRREREVRALREREEHAQRAVLDERLRIARELHDVLAHNLTLVNAQAGVARYLLRTDVDAAERALRDITGHTGRAIDELRSTIGLLRARDDDPTPLDDGGGMPGAGPGPRAGAVGLGGAGIPGDALRPVPGLDALGELVTDLRTTGTRVEVGVAGEPVPLAQHVDLAAYRIVQESLTNAAKHAPGTVVEVAIAWSGAGVRLRITNPAPAPARPGPFAPAPGTGNGLIGMRERATAAGGTLRAGPLPDGGFEVVATLPAAPSSRSAPVTAPVSNPAATPTPNPTGEPHR
ncbi:MAG TPA: sensor histidine kinase [Cellulomonas sp.]